MQTDPIPTPDRARSGPQVKICGLTTPAQAQQCAILGADAIGLVFYAKSPRNLSTRQAGKICRGLPPGVAAVGVFVDMPVEKIVSITSANGIRTVQLHGRETPSQVARLSRAGLKVIKALFTNRQPDIAQARRYESAVAFLVECGQGKLPGGNALTWDWKLPGKLFQRQPVILAGGLDPENIDTALRTGRPDAVDVSSGVELAPGQKDLRKVEAFLSAVKGASGDWYQSENRIPRRVF